MSALPRTSLLSVLALLGVLGWATGPGTGRKESAPTPAGPTPVGEFRVSGPFTHDNLTVFLLHGPDTLPPRPIATLDEALAAGSFVVHETGTVNTLVVENRSASDDVLIQPGDIVKGGRQDRVFASAVLVPARSGPIAVSSFCVEQGRWSRRGGEAAANFAVNNAQIAGKDLKNAALVEGRQGAVWENVQKLNAKLSTTVGQPVADPQSPTSLQLALESRAVNDRLRGYEEALGSLLRGSRQAVGYVVAVNGTVTGAEVYGSSAVLAKAWPKALRAAAVEALAEKDATKGFSHPDAAAALAFLLDAENGQREQAAARGPEPMAPDQPFIRTHTHFPAAASGRATGEERVSAFSALDPAIVEQLRGTANSQPSMKDPAPQQDANVAMTGEFRGRVQASRVQVLGDAGGQAAVAAAPAPVVTSRVSGSRAVLVESRDRANPSVIIHRSYVGK